MRRLITPFRHQLTLVTRPSITQCSIYRPRIGIMYGMSTMVDPVDTLQHYRHQIQTDITSAWPSYEKLKRDEPETWQKLSREDFVTIRAELWHTKQWGVEDLVLEIIEDMRKLDHQWSILEYNDYFMVKLYQSKYNDILNMYKGEFQQKGIPLSVGSFNVILATYIMVGDTQSAAELVKKMVRGDVVPSIRDFERTMRRCMPHNATIVETAKALISDHGFTTTRILDTNLIHLFGEKRAEDVRRLYLAQKSRKLDLSTYGILLRGFVDSRQIKVAQSIYEDMVNAGVKPSTFVCSTMLTVFTHRRDVASAEKIIQETLKNGHELDITIYTQLIKVYFKARQTAKAFHVFNEIQKSPSMKLNDVGFIKANDHASAAAVMTDMQKLQLNPDTITFTTMIEAVLSSKQPSSAQESLQMLTTAGMRPNIYTFNAMLNWWVKAQNMREAERTLDILKSPPYNFHPTVHTYTNMLQGYAETMDLPKAMQTFQTMLRSDQKPDRAAFHFMIVSFLRASRLQDAMVCVKRMRAMDVNPTKDTWMLLLDECHLRRDWVVGAEVVQELDASGFVLTSDALKRAYQSIKNRCT
ncbi:hypothetical protein PHYBLDRAFT_63243 [Phycomyces blakesleeanus NRRL 1555(-)]|uniref:Pentatricopeptide repeat-containing protein-mitochondrial domain-containing protein n=1 Tax=Phycomyces blakesleeanus (strain ATCC 8743b / DSM 1359 / FGSC 10004 / NBRC 33097 / NRRL 1555) TaxID=763407 RepID=A0A162Q265_PHYB8|nr:hypothetical protein PHYBLDRAFT_63243 [Phycomyces blakesleeanus NRRL 1555(-)]OAD76546.1 hypothetical protein PHYBLDRAFT_63243 [Phycomyces blakesleeanus NRRL 1555(-)]|eukprot:XP_018294586.1 hypothetical protein PHYBLDRAFT_63243 [Phycomyces blakesleeanus NRRL 1555(-)]